MEEYKEYARVPPWTPSPQFRPVITAHVVGDCGAWDTDAAREIGRRHPWAEDDFRFWAVGKHANDYGLGSARFSECGGIVVCHLVARCDTPAAGRPKLGVDGPALAYATKRLRDRAFFLNAAVDLFPPEGYPENDFLKCADRELDANRIPVRIVHPTEVRPREFVTTYTAAGEGG